MSPPDRAPALTPEPQLGARVQSPEIPFDAYGKVSARKAGVAPCVVDEVDVGILRVWELAVSVVAAHAFGN